VAAKKIDSLAIGLSGHWDKIAQKFACSFIDKKHFH
jgi:hypothetical protein